MTDKYIAYQNSKEWEVLTEKLKKRSRICHSGKCVCEDCGTNTCGPLQIHHLTYKYLYDEINHLTTVILIGRDCHQKRHPDKQIPGSIINSTINANIKTDFQDVGAGAEIEILRPLAQDAETKALMDRLRALDA